MQNFRLDVKENLVAMNDVFVSRYNDLLIKSQ